eukprot:10423377-Alexandrium_andersonii.AAC.1
MGRRACVSEGSCAFARALAFALAFPVVFRFLAAGVARPSASPVSASVAFVFEQCVFTSLEPSS